VIIAALLNAIASNNLLKLIYTLALGEKGLRARLILGFGVLIVAGVTFAFL
jgi:hypothetical protein